MRILVSALACAPQLGSEALVGYRTIQALAKRFEVEGITSSGMQLPAQIPSHTLSVRFDDPNDVSTAQLLRFELKQRRLVRQLPQPDLLHRLTPSGQKPTLIPKSITPLLLGPILLSEPPPLAFEGIFRPTLPRQISPQGALDRIAHGVARRIFDRYSTLESLMDSATAILVGTRLTARLLPEQLRSRARFLTYAGVELDTFTPPSTPRSEIPQLLFVGRLVPYKGIELLLRAAALAITRCKFRLTIVGTGAANYTRYCQALISSLDLTPTVTLLPHQPRATLPDLYRASDIFCMPSIETYGLAIIEAMSCGCVPLVADFNGPGEIVAEGTGLKVPLRNPDQFINNYADRIVELVEQRTLRETLAHQAREHVVRTHDWQQIERALITIYGELFPSG